jgi:hypothetical protein
VSAVFRLDVRFIIRQTRQAKPRRLDALSLSSACSAAAMSRLRDLFRREVAARPTVPQYLFDFAATDRFRWTPAGQLHKALFRANYFFLRSN